MHRNVLLTVATFVGCVGYLASGEAAAQQLLMPRMGYPAAAPQQVSPMLITSPVVSPYLNMTELAQFGVGNYQTLVQPFVQQRQIAIQQNSSIQQLQKQVRNDATNAKRSGGSIRDTGHETRYFNYSHYFGNTKPY